MQQQPNNITWKWHHHDGYDGGLWWGITMGEIGFNTMEFCLKTSVPLLHGCHDEITFMWSHDVTFISDITQQHCCWGQGFPCWPGSSEQERIHNTWGSLSRCGGLTSLSYFLRHIRSCLNCAVMGLILLIFLTVARVSYFRESSLFWRRRHC